MAFMHYAPHKPEWICSFSIFGIIFCFGLMWQVAHTSPIVKETLYDKNDSLVILNATSFYSSVFDKDNAWVIEFYNSWCGHCKRFAPTWVKFAKDIKGWSNVVQVGVVDCSDNLNVALCRDFMVEGFPTIRMLKPKTAHGQLGTNMDHAGDMVALRRQLVRFLAQVPEAPPSWPRLHPRSVKDLAESSSSAATAGGHQNKYQYAVLEPESSYLGRELSLDLSSVPSSEIVRIIYDATDLNMAATFGNVSQSDLPLVFNISGLGQSPRLIFSGAHMADPREYFLTLVNAGHYPKRSHLALPQKKIFKGVQTFSKMPHMPEAHVTPILRVYMVDLENALAYLFNQEVAVHYTIKDDSLKALQGFLKVLAKYFPGRTPVQCMLRRMRDWVEVQPVFQMTQLLTYVSHSTTDSCFLPPLQEWVGCRGSVVGYRGYPCSLWVLFHTLTVGAYNHDYANSGKNKSAKVLFAIREYVHHFFSCRDCAQHFLEMSRGLEEEVRFPNDTVLWLWWAHNRVNQRLAGDFTEDPLFPKVQFPPASLCYACRRPDKTQHWDLDAVLSFLTTFYARERIDRHTGVYARHQRYADNLQTTLVPVLSAVQAAPGHFSSIDLSLCFVLYCASALLLIALYFFFILRRKRRKLLGSQSLIVLSVY